MGKEKIFDLERKMNVFLFFSGGASVMKYLIENDPNYGKLYEIVGAFTNNPEAKGQEIAKKHNIPCEVLEHVPSESREEYYTRVLRKVKSYDTDLISLSGYMDIVTYPLIESKDRKGEFTNKILNIHPADSGIMKKKGKNLRFESFRMPKDLSPKAAEKIIRENNLERAYKGKYSVMDSILNNEEYTQSTCHLAQEKYDEGPIITQSKKFSVDTAFVDKKLRKRDWMGLIEYASTLQEKMKWEGDGPAYKKALEVIAQGRLSIDEDNSLYLDEKELPYCGIQLLC